MMERTKDTNQYYVYLESSDGTHRGTTVTLDENAFRFIEALGARLKKADTWPAKIGLGIVRSGVPQYRVTE